MLSSFRIRLSDDKDRAEAEAEAVDSSATAIQTPSMAPQSKTQLTSSPPSSSSSSSSVIGHASPEQQQQQQSYSIVNFVYNTAASVYNFFRGNDHNHDNVIEEILQSQEKEKEAIGEVCYKLEAVNEEIEAATKVLNDQCTSSVESNFDSAIKMYKASIEDLEECKKTAKSAAEELLNQRLKTNEDHSTTAEVSNTGATTYNYPDFMEIAVTEQGDEELSESRSQNPYEETLAKLEKAAVHMKQVAEQFRDKKDENHLEDDNDEFAGQVQQLHQHTEQTVQAALQKVSGLRQDLKESLLKSLPQTDIILDSKDDNNILQNSSKENDDEDEDVEVAGKDREDEEPVDDTEKMNNILMNSFDD